MTLETSHNFHKKENNHNQMNNSVKFFIFSLKEPENEVLSSIINFLSTEKD